MKKLLVLFGLMFVIFACSNDCLNMVNECFNGNFSEKNNNENNQGNSNTENPEKRPTTLQEVVDNANAGEEIDLSDYELTSYTATVNKKLTIKNGSLSGANLTVTSENVKLEKLADLSVTSSSRLTINDSKLSNLLIGGNGETSRSRASEAQTSLAMVTVTDSEIENVELNGFNSQLNITDTATKIDDIITSTKSMIILEAGSYDGMKDPVVEDNGELTRIDMTKDKTLSILSIYSNPKKAEYKLNEEIDLTGLIVMGTYTASVEIFKSGGWKGEATESVTKWEDEEDYDVDYDFSKTGVRIVTIKSTINPDVACNFYVYVVDDSQNNGTSQPEKIEFTNIRVESLLLMPKTSYKVGEKLDLSGYRVMGTYNGLDVNLQYTSEPANGTVLTAENTQITFYYNGESVETKEITVRRPCTVEFYDGIGSSELVCKTEVAFGESLKLPVAPSKTGYTFDVWVDESKNEVTSEDIVKNDLKLYATWTANTYTVKFDSNGGNGEMGSQTFTYDKEEPLTANTFSRTGYTFAGWATSKDGNVVYADKKNVKNLTVTKNGEVTLYAKWNANTDTAYTVEHYQQNINDNQYSLKDTENKTGTTGENTSAEAKTYAGFTAKSVTQEKIAADGSTVVEIYYDRKEITLTLNLNGGDGEKEITGKYGTAVTAPTNPTKTGYTFASWNPELPATLPAENVTYTAKWTKIEEKISVELPVYTEISGLTEPPTNADGVVTFKAPSEYENYNWYVDGDLKGQSGNEFTLNTSDMNGGIYTVMVVVTDSNGDVYSAEYRLTISK